MNKRSAPALDRNTPLNCGCFADAAPLPMGCALCGHSPYAHGCPGQNADHEYVQPDGALMNARLEARRHGGPVRLPAPRPPAEVAPIEVIPLVPAQRRPGVEVELPVSAPVVPFPEPVPAEPPVEDEPAVEPEQQPAIRPARPPLPRRTRRPLLPPAATRPPRRRDGDRPAPGGVRGAGRTAPRPARPPVGALQSLLSHHIGRTCPTFTAPEQVLDRKRGAIVNDGKATEPSPTIPGWRLLISDRGRFWAFRKEAFPDEAKRAGAEPDVVADTFDEIQALTERQEEIARQAADRGAAS
ncbi:hypothetical protein [Streptosporangium sp. NPDC020145]|uniref:hypothetical protein n=1 Tax=Streptosporangium sp. NPDC020145 TaxID=3154694 RepID=UPI0034402922